MRSKVFGFCALVCVFTISIGFSVTAEKPSFEENFLIDAGLVEAKSGKYQFDTSHSSIGFKVKHMGLVDVPGYFNKFEGEVFYDAENISKSSVNFKIDAASVDTRHDRRDKHLRSADFFEVETHPSITFRSSKVEKNGDTLKVTGDFMMRGKKKEITIPVKVVGFKEGRGNSMVMGATATTSIKRSEFGINYGVSTGAIGDDVKIEINVEAKAR